MDPSQPYGAAPFHMPPPPAAADVHGQAPPQLPDAAGDEPQLNNLIVNYIPAHLTESDLRNLFTPYGTMLHCKLVLDKLTGACSGFFEKIAMDLLLLFFF